MITVIYDDNARSYSDVGAVMLAISIKKALNENKPIEPVHTSTENVIQCLRWEVAQGNIQPDNITFKFQGTVISIDRYGVFTPKVKGFNDFHTSFFMSIVDTAFKTRQSEKLAQPIGVEK